MTQMQVDFQKLLETQRHNAEMERQGLMEQETKSRQADASMKSAIAAENTAIAKMIQAVPSAIKNVAEGIAPLFLL